MAVPRLLSYGILPGQTIYAGRYRSSVLSGNVTVDETTASGSISSVGAVPGFGSGPATGTYVGDTWTPGRDGSGVVNQASWDIVPTGKWSKIAGSRLDGLDATIKAAIPGWTDGGNWRGLARSWAGCAIDAENARMFFFGGGHSDSSNNGLYKWEGYKMAWEIECLPSDSTLFGSSFVGTGSYTFDARSHGAYLAYGGAAPAINGPFYDENFNDQKPNARHTYNSLVYVPDRQEIFMMCRRMWRYSLTTGTWNYRRIWNDSFSYPFEGEEIFAFYDITTGEVVAGATGSGGYHNSVAFDTNALTWGSRISPFAWLAWIAADVTGDFMTVHTPNRATHGWDYAHITISGATSGSVVGVYNMVGVTYPEFMSEYELASFIYVASINRYWLFTQMADGVTQRWFEADPTTTPWTLTPKTFTGATPTSAPYPQSGRKGMFVEAMNAVIFWTDADAEVSIYKL